VYLQFVPLPVITVSQMREWEQAAWASGQTESEVIRRVGESVARRALELTRPGERVIIVAGKGHNGEDARHAGPSLNGRRVDLLEIIEPAKELTRLEALLSLHPSLLIDGLFGVGINRPLSQDWITLIETINKSGVRVLAVDVPSGLNGDTGQPQGAGVRSTVTLTVGAPKIGLLRERAWEFVGRLEVTPDVGLLPCPLTSELRWGLPEDFAGFPPRRAEASNKGSYGHLTIVAGSPGYHGAAVLASNGAQRAQPGLITLITMQDVYHPIACQLQAVMVSPWRGAVELPKTSSALVVGPGLAAADVPQQIKDFVIEQWRNSPLPVVIDASALDWLPNATGHPKAIRVVTPHPGEAARMLGTTSQQVQSNRVEAVQNLSRRLGDALVVLKGHQTLIGGSQGEIFVNPSGNPHLAQGGSGDVLAGFIGGLLAQPALQAEAVTTVRYAVWQHGVAADYLQETCSNWIVEDLLENLGNQRPEIVR
jgi:hydroxyethylthiazole kinase-like uncharacterized protein yjeF